MLCLYVAKQVWGLVKGCKWHLLRIKEGLFDTLFFSDGTMQL